jgi:hypothetical protein
MAESSDRALAPDEASLVAAAHPARVHHHGAITALEEP